MKETGIVRKLDNLGRLVIPKEIRRCLRIKEGSPIEFGLLSTGEIVLCKYSLVNQISDFAEEFCEVISDTFDCVTIIADRDKIISSKGVSKKHLKDMTLSNQIMEIDKQYYLANDTEKIKPIIEEDGITYKSQLIYPIVIQGEKEGVIILASTDKANMFNNEHILSLKLISKFLSLQLE